MSAHSAPLYCQRCKLWILPRQFVFPPDSRDAVCPGCGSRLFTYGPYPRNVRHPPYRRSLDPDYV